MKEVPALAQIPEIYPAHASRPFVRPHGSGIVFSAVFPRGMECGLQLIHTPDGETLYIPFTDEFRVGRVCSAMITPLDSKEWMYRYKSGEHWIPDPHAFAIGRTVICEGEERKEVTACSCAPLRAGDLFAGAPEKPLPPADWSKEVIYGLHIRGFSAARESLDENLRGTFTGAAAGIPYLRGLGVTAVEIMPVYTPLPDRTQNKQFRTMGEALGAYPVGPNGDPLRDLKSRPNYWGFGAGLYCALRSEYGTQEEFAAMIHAFHKAGMRVILQMYFEKGVLVQEQIEILRFYIDRYGVDGFRLRDLLIRKAPLRQILHWRIRHFSAIHSLLRSWKMRPRTPVRFITQILKKFFLHLQITQTEEGKIPESSREEHTVPDRVQGLLHIARPGDSRLRSLSTISPV